MVSLDCRIHPDRLAGGHHEPGAVAVVEGGAGAAVQSHRIGVVQRLTLDAHALTLVDELPPPLEGVDVDDGRRMGGHVVHRILRHHGEAEEDEDDDDGDDGVGDLQAEVVLELTRDLVGSAPVADDRPDDQKRR